MRISGSNLQMKNMNFTTIMYHTQFSKEWKQIRVITCLIFDEAALATLRESITYSGLLPPDPKNLTDPQLLDFLDVKDLVQSLQAQPLLDNLLAAIE